AETQRHIFDPFFTTKESGKGTGLGLSISRTIVAQAGGHISVRSTPGAGATFDVLLPEWSAEAPQTSDAAPTVSRGTETVLVIEDDEAVRNSVRRVLTDQGYRVLTASDGREALALCRNHRGHLDLVLTDVIVPGRSGPELAREVCKESAGTRALFMSGHVDHALLKSDALIEAANFIRKPFLPEALAK